ncbi:hypothetical protein A3K82_00745 [Candidatus Pacearchaeota archaeon RBG_19FT_COMBO_34_9]|nr:MAG: hypothetical protein A3K82_00745 [Candidatus Pacearchaeota archaeon RBG_19FT_COMBO_34_9]OGJ16306.1 MAG: hypothetical protein A3K74_02110 [Candidatus Pacearchaeota archaeon RBG_13_33_26]
MKRGIGDRTILDDFVEDFCNVVEKHVKYIVCSGFVAISHGRSRATEDIDMIIEKIPEERFIKFHNDLVKSGFECMQSSNPKEIYEDYLINGDSVRYTRKNEFLPEMEIKFTKDELDEEQIKSRRKIPFTKLDIYFSSIESNIAFKEEYLKAEKDLEDAKHLRIIYEGKIDENEINKIKERIRRFRYGK